MNHVKIIGRALPNIPWQERPAGSSAPVWRYKENPVIPRNPLPGVARIFNSAVIPYEGKFIGVFRGEQVNGIPYIYVGHSDDAVHWRFEPEKINFVDENGAPFMPSYAYDPRLIEVDGVYYAIWCQDAFGATLGMAKTTDFKTFTRLENPFPPFSRNGVLFPRRVNGKYLLLSRPSDSGHTPFGDIWLSESHDLEYWGHHRHVMGRSSEWWENVKIGGGAVLARGEPSKVLYRCSDFLITPEEWYEERGFVPNVCFPCATLQDADTGRIAIYYGAADTYVGLAFAEVDSLVEYIKTHDAASAEDRAAGRR